jgi:hypothetical protein
MTIEAIQWFGIQIHTEEALFVCPGMQIPAETKHFNGTGVVIELLLAEEFRAILDNKSNGFSNG